MIKKYFAITLLMLATSIEVVQCKKSKSNNSQNKHIKNNIDYNAFQLAVTHKDIHKVSMFLQAGANINHQDEYQDSMLHCAIKSGSIEMVQLLINAGANLEIIKNFYVTPLVYAMSCVAEQGHFNEYNDNYITIVKMLVDAGAKKIIPGGESIEEFIDTLIDNALYFQEILTANPDLVSDEIDSEVFELEGGEILAMPYITSVDYKKIETDLLQVRMILQSK